MLKLYKAYDFTVGGSDSDAISTGKTNFSAKKADFPTGKAIFPAEGSASEITAKTEAKSEKQSEITAIFIHGVAADSSSFAGLFEYLKTAKIETRIHVIAFDLLGAGKSPKDEELNFGISEQLLALKNSIRELNLKKFVLVGHSMGTFLAERYAATHQREVERLVLISPPVYTPEDLKNPFFQVALNGFRETVRAKNPELANSRTFENELKYIVSNPNNYQYLAKIKQKTMIIFGELDRIIMSTNIPRILKENSRISALSTAGAHGVSREKYAKILRAIEGKEEAESLTEIVAKIKRSAEEMMEKMKATKGGEKAKVIKRDDAVKGGGNA